MSIKIRLATKADSKDCEVRKIKVSTFAKGSVWEVDAKEYEKIYRH